jgi:hypothetical protein
MHSACQPRAKRSFSRPIPADHVSALISDIYKEQSQSDYRSLSRLIAFKTARMETGFQRMSGSRFPFASSDLGPEP